MTTPDCSENTDPLKLVRDGTDKVQRTEAAPDPARVPVDERCPEHAMVFASAYAQFLQHFGLTNTVDGNWQPFFAGDVSAQLAVVAIEDVTVYRSTLKALLRSLEDPELPASGADMKEALGAVFDCLGTLAARLDTLKEGLPADQPLEATLRNLIQGQLSPMLRRLIGYFRAGALLSVVEPAAAPLSDIVILGRPVESFNTLLTGDGLSDDWAEGVEVADWAAYIAVAAAGYVGAYGPGANDVDRINYLAGHNLFNAICETFLAVFARVVDEARLALDASFEWAGHQPHYALFLAFLKLFEHARAETNTLTTRHLDFYYRRVLQLKERPAQPGQAHVLVELAKHAAAHQLTEGTLLKAGKDDAGADAHFAVDRELVANKASVAELKSLYRHHNTPGETLAFNDDRIFAVPQVDTAAEFHPFANKVFEDGDLTRIDMPQAEVGFAIASHHLWLAEGTRRVTVVFENVTAENLGLAAPDLSCRFTTEKGWVDAEVDDYTATAGGVEMTLVLDGNAPAVTPYDPKVHGYRFDTSSPVLVVLLRHRVDSAWDYAQLEKLRTTRVQLGVHVQGLKQLALSNDHGAVDSSKPFLAYGAAPTANSSLVIGSKEVFQKRPCVVVLHAEKMVEAVASGTNPQLSVEYLDEGTWKPFNPAIAYDDDVNFDSSLLYALPLPAVEEPDLTPNEAYSTSSRTGFVRLRLDGGFGTDTYPTALATWIAQGSEGTAPTAPVVPNLSSLSIEYLTLDAIDLTQPPSEARGRFFQISPFGNAEQLPPSGSGGVAILPQFRAGAEAAEGELYIGVAGLVPPQNLALLFQVTDGTANPLVVKPERHLEWTYLRGNEWAPFPLDAVGDGTDGLLASGIVTLSVPDDADTEHTLLPSGLHWIRVAVASASDAVCRLLVVAAQALRATYVVPDNGSSSHTYELPAATITKLDTPDAAVKSIAQPFPTFGGKPVETTLAFATRVSERLRHKDRGITLWDDEHLVLEAFPEIYQVRCLNHTQYEPSASGTGIYRELAPGHVTIVTIPDLAVPNPRDPLRPFTSLRVLGEIERFLARRVSCFVELHVRNPQFEEVRVDLRVRFRDGVDETFHENRLRTEITQFLSPWAFRSDARPSFNGKVHKSVLVNFVEERPYVDYVTDVHLFRRLPGATADGPDLEEVAGSRAVSILVSVPADEHSVTPIHDDDDLVGEKCACGPLVEMADTL